MTHTILGVDLGSDNIGLAYITVTDTFKIADIRLNGFKTKPEIYPVEPRQLPSGKMRYVADTIVTNTIASEAGTVIIERPFISPTHPHAGVVLFQLCDYLVSRLQTSIPTVDVKMITAPQARSILKYKKLAGVTTKDAVTECINNLSEISPWLNHINQASEHAKDALVVALAYTNKYILSLG